MKKIVLGMSGGVDSSVAALLLKKQGYQVIGVFMKNYSETKNQLTGECHWVEEREMAKKMAAILQIPLITIDHEKEYKKDVINRMFSDYTKGLTPNPDILCNQIIKFPFLWKKAKELKADYIATGHYARIKKQNGKYLLLRGKDKYKDQSYFLYTLSQSDLSHAMFPVGNLTKSQVREIAKKNKLSNWNKKGTSGICFVGKTDMKQLLMKKIKKKEGKVLSPNKETIGAHPGISYFTIGERFKDKFIKINPEFRKKMIGRWYVAEKKGNSITIVPENHELLKKRKIIIKKIHFITNVQKGKMQARIRHGGELKNGELINKLNKWIFEFDKGVEGVAEGQSIVLYKGNVVIGGGEIRLKR